MKLHYDEGYSDGYDDGFGAGAKEVEGGSIGLILLCVLVLLVGLGAGFFAGRAL